MSTTAGKMFTMIKVYIISLLNSTSASCLFAGCVLKFRCFQAEGSKLKSAPVFKTKQLYLPETKNKYPDTYTHSHCVFLAAQEQFN